MSDRVEVLAAVERLFEASPECCDRAGLDTVVADCGRVRSWLDAFDARIALRARDLERDGKSDSPTDVLRNQGRRSASESRAAARRAEACGRSPAVHDALASGQISAGHVDALIRARSGLSAGEQLAFDDCTPELVAAAKAMSVEEFGRECRATARGCADDDGESELERQRRRRRISRRRDEETGMVITTIVLDPVTDEQMWNSIDRATKAAMLSGTLPADARWDHVAVDTVVGWIVRGGAERRPAERTPSPAPEAEPLFATPAEDTEDAGDRLDPDVPGDGDGNEPAAPGDAQAPSDAVVANAPDVVVLIDWDALSGAADAAGLVSETLGGVPVPVSTVRRWCCEARIIPVVLGGDGVVLDAGRGARLATTDQRRALATMYASCAYPGCTVEFARCKVHHTREWTRHGGPTDLEWLVPLCDRHHHLVHEGGWRLDVQADRTITVTRPDGEVHYHGTSLNRRRRPPPTAA